jgi:protein HOOK3
MSEQERKEISAFISFFATFDLARPVTTVTDLSDGAALFDVLALVYVHCFISNARRN